MKLNEMENIIYKEYSNAIDTIIANSTEERAEGQYKPDTGVAVHMLIKYVDSVETSPFIDIQKARARFAELKAKLEE